MATAYIMPTDLEVQLNILTEGKSRKLVKCSDHPEAHIPLRIYNYTTPHGKRAAPQNQLINICRGLVIERGTGAVIARPMSAFPNYNAKLVESLTDKSFTVLEKLDGSLGIWFCYQGEWMMATRGSFNSPQALEGARIAKSAGLNQRCDPRKTYCFEIIYPTNKICVDYGNRTELVLLAVIDTLSADDTPNSELAEIAKELGVTSAKSFEAIDVDKLQALDLDNEEGFVIRLNENGERAKVKFQNWYDRQKKPQKQKPKKEVEEKLEHEA